MGNEALWLYFHAERRAIEQRYPALSGDTGERDALRGFRDGALSLLRDEVLRAIALGHAGPYLIPV